MPIKVLFVSAVVLGVLNGPVAAQSLGDAPPAQAAVPQASAALAPIPAADLTAGDDILSTLKANGQFSILVEALSRSGLSAVLQRSGPYTIAAPTNTAFQALPAAQLAALMTPENAQQLQALLAYHLINAAVPPLEINGGKLMVSTVGHRDVVIDATASPARFDEADVQGQMHVSNGYIYVVDKVLIGQSTPRPTPAPATASPAG